ncbi:CAP domain-containing protein [Amedibacterium intestinale]|uniref:CAP domain-containing protein n=1 Tax=Amedibacterium intestinale TaxID=2583452 RepID=UPI000E5484E9|nr:CAP domain-containing protein [Amedibacterium intestinale]RHO21892.1 hypothetical protein DW220_06065 [Eubacterium sp. AM18-26]
MKKKILYVIALVLLCSAGCSNAQEKDQPNKETAKDKVTVTNQTKEDKTTQQEKEETKNEDNDDTKKEEQPSSTKQPSSSNTKKFSPKTEVPQVNQPSKENTKDTSKPTNKPSNPPKQDIPETPPKEEVKNTPVKQSAMEVEVLNKINNYRAENGLQPLSSSQYYQEKVNAHAYAMAEKEPYGMKIMVSVLPTRLIHLLLGSIHLNIKVLSLLQTIPLVLSQSIM